MPYNSTIIRGREKEMRILVAEDESDIGETYKIVLENNGHEVVVTENGEECLDVYSNELKRMKTIRDNSHKNNNKHQVNTLLYSSSSFDAVVLDYKMPKKDGME